MTCLPETEKDDKVLGDEKGFGGTEEKEKKPAGFGTGFLTGILATLVCAAVFMAGWLIAQNKLQDHRTKTLQQGAEVLTDYETLTTLDEVQSLIAQNYLNEVDSEMLSAYLFKGIAAGLGDPYANYYSEEELQSVLDSTRGEYYGVGATLTEDINTREIRVLEVYDNSPASESGLQPGDILTALDDTYLAGSGLSEVVALIKSRDGPFVLTIYRPDTEEELKLELECGEVELEYVEAEMKTDEIGYIRISEFTEIAVDQFKSAVPALQEQGMEKLIVDLRSNPGGLLTAVCDILDEILPEGLIVYTEDKDGNREEYRADGARMIDCEVAVLVNGDSASASEIFAGAIQDHGLGPVIGTQTYGKGVVQKTFPLSDGSAFKLTVQKYFTPLGQDIDGNGITPDILVEESKEDADERTEADAGTDETELTGDGADEEPEAAAPDEAETEASDPVLARALEELGR